LHSSTHRIELLAPARTAESGIVAVNFGADAVYIGAPAFSARAAAGNTVGEIARLVSYAHRYYARVFVALNTIVYDHELDEVHRLIWQLHEAGADALIVQDMGILKMDLPPVELHASTQTNAYEPERIQFLEAAGFRRIVLARELSLDQIAHIRRNTNVELESFVHGALCVSLSGQCYLSEALGGRSGNRGVCAQPCRKTYDLIDATGQILEKQKHLLSLKDLQLGDHLAEMAYAGISSFKIEGRLKDDNYLKNITAWYRKRVDAFLSGNPDFRKASSGKVYFDFVPHPDKTFSRGTSDYFLHGRTPDIVSFDTPKSAGEFIGTVSQSRGRMLVIDPDQVLGNNDGLCFFNRKGQLEGVKVNVAKGNSIELAHPVELLPGTKIYRNYDHAFNEMLRKSRTFRKIGLTMEIGISRNRIQLTGLDEDGNRFQLEFDHTAAMARDKERAGEALKEQFSKTGDTHFEITDIRLDWTEPVFIPASVINRIRRDFLNRFMEYRESLFKPNVPYVPVKSFGKVFASVDYTWNVSNRMAKAFYADFGADVVEPAPEISGEFTGKRLMTMKHCLKYQLGNCPKEKSQLKGALKEPLFLDDGRRRFRLEFDCRACRMNLYL
jgi:23S rRNA 5-hydroxycytidine C2501 synthase